MMKKLILCLTILLVASPVFAGSLSFTTYSHAPVGVFDRLRFVPVATPPVTCDADYLGGFYVDSDDSLLYFCDGTAWGPYTAGLWINFATTVIPKFNSWGNPNTSLGIGTEGWYVPATHNLTISQNPSILSEGDRIDSNVATGYDFSSTPNFLWSTDTAVFHAGFTGESYISGKYSISFGQEIVVESYKSSILGGYENYLDSPFSVIGGGGYPDGAVDNNTVYQGNIVLSELSTIIGGESNTIKVNSASSFIGGGQLNEVHGDFNAIAGGANNTSSGQADFSFIAGGSDNHIYGLPHSTILGGRGHDTDKEGMFIGGGRGPFGASPINYDGKAHFGTILGGYENYAGGGNSSSIGGGVSNKTLGVNQTVIGGANNLNDNTGTAPSSTILGGGSTTLANRNYTKGNFATIMGGEKNVADASRSFIGGGFNNLISIDSSTIAGGKDNENNGNHSFIAGGFSNTSESTATGGTVILGGTNNDTASAKSLAAGICGRATSNTTFYWGNNAECTSADKPASGNPERFIIGGNIDPLDTPTKVGIGVLNPAHELHIKSEPGLGDTERHLLLSRNSSKILLIHPAHGSKAEVIAGGPNVVQMYIDNNGQVGYDLAEEFETSQTVTPGDLLVMDENQEKLKKSTHPYDQNVIGVVSHSPATLFKGSEIVMLPEAYSFKEGTNPPVALAGRVNLKVSLENGPIERGDLLTSSSTPGYAMKVNDFKKAFNTVVAKALEPYNQDSKNAKVDQILVIMMSN